MSFWRTETDVLFCTMRPHQRLGQAQILIRGMIFVGSEWTWHVKQNTPQITVPESLLLHYRKQIGLDAVIVWMYLQLLSQKMTGGQEVDVLQWLQEVLEWESFRVQEGFCLLVENSLVAVEGASCTVLMPDSAQFDEEQRITPVEAVSEAMPNQGFRSPSLHQSEQDTLEADVAAVVDLYEKRLGTLSPMQKAKLRFWMQAKGMAADVTAYAVEYVTKQDELASLHTIELQLRRWYIAGVRDIQSLMQHLEDREF